MHGTSAYRGPVESDSLRLIRPNEGSGACFWLLAVPYASDQAFTRLISGVPHCASAGFPSACRSSSNDRFGRKSPFCASRHL
jgi:hypothetical protein